MGKRFFTLLLFFFFLFSFVSAHQPRIVYDQTTIYEEIKNPEISQAFYGELRGNADIYIINSESDFALYLNILSPNISDVRKDFVLEISSKEENFTVSKQDWELFHEEFGGDDYWRGPEFEKNVSAGTYFIQVKNGGNLGRYSLAVGKIESFPLNEMFGSVYSILRLKKDFFNKGYFSFFEGIIGKGVAVILFILLIIVFLIFKKKRNKRLF